MNNYLYIKDETLLNILVFLFFIFSIMLCLLVLYKNKKKKDNKKVINELKKIQELTRKENSKIKSTPIEKIITS
mgnify:FL=1|tara:strand:- start:934 stop:1155 length:222 start_codon:yes stop_codon:yes gene_type:complete